MKPKRCAIYARISTKDGRQNTDNQIRELRLWAERLDLEVVCEYVDEASGSKSDRKRLTVMFKDAHSRKFDVVLVWALDRLSREGITKVASYLEQLKRSDVRLMSHQESWVDTGGPTSELLLAIFAWIAKQERERIRERIKAGLDTAKAKGKTLGRPKRSIDADKARKLRLEGHSVRKIAQFIGAPRSTVARTLSQNPPC